MTARLRHMVKRRLLEHGIVVSRPPGQFNIAQHKLAAARARGLTIRAAIDGGAADGSWTRAFRHVYPDAEVLCIEPRASCADDLQRIAQELGHVRYAGLCIGASEGTVELNEHGDQTSMLENSLGERFGERRVCQVARLDDLVAATGFPYPDLIKLDLQGGELEALRGATQCLEHTQALLLEVSLFAFQKGAPLLHDVVAFCHDHGFHVYDVSGLWHRPLDGALAQGDLMFLRADHPLAADARWSTNFA
jgi:FkbM family methyltransferase